jgi:hypothetical protein
LWSSATGVIDEDDNEVVVVVTPDLMVKKFKMISKIADFVIVALQICRKSALNPILAMHAFERDIQTKERYGRLAYSLTSRNYFRSIS